MNYRNHRKIVIIDGTTSFIGGINVCDKYINQHPNQLYWRETHLMIKGFSSFTLQRVFLSDWNFCSRENLTLNSDYLPFDMVEATQNYYDNIVYCSHEYDSPYI